MKQYRETAAILVLCIVAAFACFSSGKSTTSVGLKLPSGEVVRSYAEQLTAYSDDEEVDESTFRVEIGESTLTIIEEPTLTVTN